MGYFNVVCGISGISMHKDEAALFPLIPSGERGCEWGAQIMSGRCTSSELSMKRPFALPIVGTLDGYGKIVDIKEDENVKAIQDFYGVSISDFAEVVSYGMFNAQIEGGFKRESGNMSSWGGMFVHRKIYDMLSQESVDEWGRKHQPVWTAPGMMDQDILEEMGFKYVKQERAGTQKLPSVDLYVLPGVPGLEARHSPAHHTLNLKCGPQETRWEHEIKVIVETVELWTGRKIAPRKVLKWKTTDAQYLEMQRSAKSLTEHYKRDLEEFRHEFARMELGIETEGTDFLEIYEKSMRNGRIVPHLVAFKMFCHNMFQMSKFFFPTAHGPQFGNHYITKALLERSLEIVNGKIKEGEEQGA